MSDGSRLGRLKKAKGAGLALLIGVGVSTTALADQSDMMTLVDPTSFAEKFSGNTQVSGQLLSGLTYAGVPSPLDPSAIGIASSEGRVCVRLTTEDGRYWASNLFKNSSGLRGPSVLSLPTAYLSQLKMYPASGLMVLAAKSDDCANLADKPLIPGIVGVLEENASLLAYVNVSQGRSTAWLELDGEAATERVNCTAPTDGARVTYSVICTIPMNDNYVPGDYTLHIAVRSLTGGGVEESYRVVIE